MVVRMGAGNRTRLVVLYLVFACSLSSRGAERTASHVGPLPRAHAHNDYYHDRPLLDALSHGFCSVEADVFLVDGALLVGHSRPELDSEKTVSKLYLDPLRQRVESNKGRVFPNGPPFTLMIDIKSAGTETYRALHNELKRYRTMLTRVESGQVVPGAVQVIVSGNRAKEAIEATDPRYVGWDGRLSDLQSELPAHLMPMISDNWRTHFQWRGKGDLSATEKTRLEGIVRQAHKAGRRVRFWATPESTNVWSALDAAGVDLVNTDALEKLEAFFRKDASRDRPAE